jgi:hypothetical protein
MAGLDPAIQLKRIARFNVDRLLYQRNLDSRVKPGYDDGGWGDGHGEP